MLDHNVLISPECLVGYLNHDNYLIVDARFSLLDSNEGKKAYYQGHIPNAVYAHLDDDLAGKVTSLTGRHPLPDIDQISMLFRSWGINNKTHVIVYDTNNGAIAARLWWLLRWLGHQRVSVLDGGIESWLRHDFALEISLPRFIEGDFKARPRLNSTWSTTTLEAWVLNNTNFTLIDARDKDRFNGLVEPIDRVAGHIPNAINVPFMEFLNPDGSWKDSDKIKQIWNDKKLNIGKNWGVMCGSGVTACHLSMSAVIAGIPEPALYPGSWSEWITDNERPVISER
jgi:thiosulfate/3-mercaptopyruvate sulfurtransferase